MRAWLAVMLAVTLALFLAGACSDDSSPRTREAAEPVTTPAALDQAEAGDPGAPQSAGPAAGPSAVPAAPESPLPPAASSATGNETGETERVEEAATAKATPPAESEQAAPQSAAGSAALDAEPEAEAEQEQPAKPVASTRVRVIRLDGDSGEVRPVRGAHVTALGVTELGDGGETALRSDAEGYFTVARETARYQVVAAGYWPARDVAPVDGVIVLRPLDVRAIYLPYEQLWNPPSIAWALGLAREGLISAIVIDIKEEGGAVLLLFATDAVLAIDAVVDPGADMVAFLSELEELGIYRIARQAVFLDTRLGRSDVETAILTRGGTQLIDDLGLGWTTPFSATARRYNIDIALQAIPYFEEIQFDYVRFPGGPLRVHEETTGEERSAAVALFAKEAVAALHAAGAAMSIDTFGETTVIRVEDAIGQVLEELIPYIDYYSPMVYPSTWAPGSFGLAYPAAEPELVVRLSIETAVQWVRDSGVVGVQVRPWLQDYRDYGPRQIAYGSDKVLVQIVASERSGGVGFMLWNPTLLYHTDVLALVAPEVDVAAAAGDES